MGKPTGFLEYERKVGRVTPPLERIQHFHEFHALLPEQEQRLQGAVFDHAETIRCQDHRLHQIGDSGGVILAFYQDHLLDLQHVLLPASASSHSAFCRRSSASNRLLFRSRSSFCRMHRHCSS